MNADLDSSREEIAATLAVSRVRMPMDTLTPASLESRWELHFAGDATGHCVIEHRTHAPTTRPSSTFILGSPLDEDGLDEDYSELFFQAVPPPSG